MKKSALVLVTSVTLLFSSMIFAKPGNEPLSTEDRVRGLNLMFIQIADQGSLQPIKGRPGYYLLTLTGVNDYVQFFSDRPARVAGLYPIDKFVRKWNHGKKPLSFKKMPPNAALSGVDSSLTKSKIVNTVLQLSEPVYNHQTKTLTYTTQLLSGNNIDHALQHLKNVALFIDSYCSSCTGQGF